MFTVTRGNITRHVDPIASSPRTRALMIAAMYPDIVRVHPSSVDKQEISWLAESGYGVEVDETVYEYVRTPVTSLPWDGMTEVELRWLDARAIVKYMAIFRRPIQKFFDEYGMVLRYGNTYAYANVPGARKSIKFIVHGEYCTPHTIYVNDGGTMDDFMRDNFCAVCKSVRLFGGYSWSSTPVSVEFCMGDQYPF